MAMTAKFVNQRAAFEVVKVRRGASNSNTAIRAKIPKKNPRRIFASPFMTQSLHRGRKWEVFIFKR
jgi:hypothetical protein